MNIKKWYLETFNDDEGLKINENANFNDMDYYEIRHIYDYLNVEDSIVRERVFEKLASLLNINYDEIYDIWVNK
jgi:energy-converting hydrogenase A subunit M